MRNKFVFMRAISKNTESETEAYRLLYKVGAHFRYKALPILLGMVLANLNCLRIY